MRGPAAASWRGSAREPSSALRRSSRSLSGRETGSRSAALSSGTISWAGCAPPHSGSCGDPWRSRSTSRSASSRSGTWRARERRISVAIGAPDTPTPPGDYYVTDKLAGADFGSYYGCCILALSGRQPNLPQGWSGGDRLAIHGSPTPTWGQAVSNGCLHADEPDLRYLMKSVPLGTVVEIHA